MATDRPSVGRPRRYDTDGLLEVAVRVFTERGYDGTSLADLAAASGTSKSALYTHVESKEHLLRLALDRALEPLFAVLEEPAATDGRAIDRLEHVVRREVEVLVERLPYVTLLLRVRGNTGTERWALGRRREFDRRVQALVAQAAAEGDLRSDVDPGTVSRLLFGTVNSVVEWYRPDRVADDGELGAEALADAVVRLAFDGLRAPAGG